MSNTNYDGKHLSTTQRIKIEKGLMEGESFASIAKTIDTSRIERTLSI